MKKILLAAFGCFVFMMTSAQVKTTADKRLASLDTAFQRVMNTWNAPGFAVAVVEKNRIIYAKGFGYSDVEKKIPVTPNTLFAIGSCTKAFTTSLIGLLQKEDKLDIDKPAHLYLPELNFFSEDLTNQVTLRDMMSHRTGLPRHDYSWYLFPSSSRDSLLRRIQYQEPTFPLRRQWQYNNFMFVAQGAIAEKITGKSWEDNIREKILVPLNMKSTNFSVHDLSKIPDAARGYGLKKDNIITRLPYYDINSAGPAGSINSSVNEMANWVITWINGGKFNGKEIIPADFAREAMSSQAVIGGGLPSKEKPGLHMNNYGFGWSISSYKGHYRVEHGGNIDGFSASTSFFPTDSIGIIVLVNQDRSLVPSIIRNIISDKLLNQPYYNWNDDLRKANELGKKQELESQQNRTSSQVKGTRPSHDLQDYEGLYTHPGYGSFDVFLKDDSLFAGTPNNLIWLQHYHYDVFKPLLRSADGYDTTETGNTGIQFNTGMNGEVESLNAIGLEVNTIKLNFVKTPKAKSVAKETLEQYAGLFEIAGMEVKFYTKGDKLHMFVEGQPEYELINTGNEKFSVKDLAGFAVQFLRDDKKQVNAVNLIQPNGTFKANRKK